ncbi:uncharacterized protein [Euphorbia lathyris]|uniref:uncharacterized protein n=1 Tax=Euphorbia lathyris TaxID=212925 RepID=UPI0033133EC9
MLSIENPPPDPSCSCQFQQLNSNSDERASASHKKLPLTPQEVDLPNPDLDHHTPLPNFSIRDYVFTARSKDIKKNWPFSFKNLQLCLKHGVKELLPPLQPLDTVSKQSLKRCMVETSSIEKGKTDTHAVLDASDDPQLNDKLAESCPDISSCRSGDDNDFPSTTTSVSHSEIESLTVNRLPSSQTKTFRRTSAASEAAGPSGNNKTENTSRPLSKKCRLIVKFGGNSDRSSAEDIASNSTTVSEIMASKVCPVCKTFSSSSNTTLNAHIDQCLSMESTPKWTSDSKLTRHRIKPRKTRMMVDIYSTALPCTLEELDRRNGTSWATVSCLPTHEVEKTRTAETINEGKKMRVSHVHPEDVGDVAETINEGKKMRVSHVHPQDVGDVAETLNEGKKMRVSQVHPENVGDVGPVYIDANGTKLRILSKFDDQPSVSKVVEDIEARKPKKGDNGGKYISKKKKKLLAQKHHKFLKLASQSNINFSQKAHGSQIVEEEYQGEAKNCEKEHMVSNQTKPSDFVTLRPWVCSKRRGLTKKTSQEGHQPMRCNWHLPQDLLVYSGQSFFEESPTERNVVQKFTNLSENPTSAKNDRIEKSFREVQVRKKMEQSLGRKRMGNLLMAARSSDNLGHSPMKLNSIQLGNCGTSVNDSRMTRPSNSTWNHSSLLSKRAFGPSGGANNSDATCTPSIKSSRDANSSLSKRMKLSSLRKNMSCVNGRSSVTDAVPGKLKKLSALKKSKLRFMKKRNEEGVTCQSGVDQEYDLMRGNAANQDEREEIANESFELSTVLKPRRGGGMRCISHGEEALALRTSKPAPHFYDHDVPVTADSVGADFLQKVDNFDSAGNQVRVYLEGVVVVPSSNTSDERSAACTMKSIDSELYELSHSLDIQPDSLRSAEDYRRLLCGTAPPPAPTEPDFVNDQEMFSAVEVGNDIVGQDSRIAAELDSEAGHGHSFPEVDPIPIPGPPGSFLPSPRDMGSEDFQGNSSLTTSRVHSSLDQHDAVDGDSSDSPMSAASTISNSTADRCNFKYSEPSSSVGPYDKIRSAAASIESSVLQSVDTIPQASGAEMERAGFDGGYLKLDRIYVEKGSLSFKNDQPCCCQRKERFSQGVSLNFQESQLLRRRKMASMTIPTGGKQMDFNSNLKLANLDVRSEFAPPSSCPNPGSEKMVLPVIKPLAGTVSFRDSPSSAGVKLLARGDSGSASPSASNPVLRLMGKNLLVVNKDDDASMPVGGVQPHIQNNPQTSQFIAFSQVSPGNTHNPVNHIGPPQASVIFGQSSHKPVGQYYDGGGLSNSFRSHSDPRLHVNAKLPAGMFQDQHMDYSFAEYHEFEGDYNISSQHIRSKNRPDADNTEKVTAAVPEHRRQHADSPQNPVQEIIIIDDVPESENAVINNVAKYNPNRVHPFSCYQSQDQSPVVESPIVRNANYHTPPSKLGNNTRPVRLGCTSEGTGVVQRSPFTAASSSPGHIRSTTLHYSPGFS